MHSRHEALCQNAGVVIDWAGHAHSTCALQRLDTIIHPSVRPKFDVIAALEKIIIRVVIRLLKQTIPHDRQMPFVDSVHIDELDGCVFYNGHHPL